MAQYPLYDPTSGMAPPKYGANLSFEPPPPPFQANPQLTSHQIAMLAPSLAPLTSGPTGNGNIAVNTEALKVFSANIGGFLPVVQDAMTVLGNLEPVAAGGFFEAYTVNDRLNPGGSSTADLVDSYTGVLKQLYKGLLDLQTATSQMVMKYTTADELNAMGVTELVNDLAPVSRDFNAMIVANGGTSTTTSVA